MPVIPAGSVNVMGEPRTRVENREDLIYLLSQAAELEHSLACQYLFAAYSLKQDPVEGLTAEQAALVKKWLRRMQQIAVEEMLHLAIVSNLLTAIGAAPSFDRANFPQPETYTTLKLDFKLARFSLDTLERFIRFETPPPPPRFALAPLDLVPKPIAFKSLGKLYELIHDGFGVVPDLFLGPKDAQVADMWSVLKPITNVADAQAAIDKIREQGEGPKRAKPEAHFQWFTDMHRELKDAQAADPNFDPARAVVESPLLYPHSDLRERELPPAGPKPTKLTHPVTRAAVEVFAATYEAMLHALGRFFVRLGEDDEQRYMLKQAALSVMRYVLTPLGQAITRLPAFEAAGKTERAGPSFELFEHVRLLPYKDAAWAYLIERFRDIAQGAATLAADAETEPYPNLRTALSEAVEVLSKYELGLTVALTPRAPGTWTWENGIRALFSPLDVEQMGNRGLNLSKYDIVSDPTSEIEERVANKSMPPRKPLLREHRVPVSARFNPQGPWTDARIGWFHDWMKAGAKKS